MFLLPIVAVQCGGCQGSFACGDSAVCPDLVQVLFGVVNEPASNDYANAEVQHVHPSCLGIKPNQLRNSDCHIPRLQCNFCCHRLIVQYYRHPQCLQAGDYDAACWSHMNAAVAAIRAAEKAAGDFQHLVAVQASSLIITTSTVLLMI
jgi:hypothetical protein